MTVHNGPAQRQVIAMGLLLLMFAGCETNKEQQFILRGITVDSLGKPVPNVRLFINEKQPSGSFFTPASVRATYLIQTDSAGKFSQGVNLGKNVTIEASCVLDSNRYFMAKCPDSSQTNSCQLETLPIIGFAGTFTFLIGRYH